MNLAEISKLKPAQQAAIMADQARATAARERIMSAHLKEADKIWIKKAAREADAEHLARMVAPPAKSPPSALSAQMQAILPQCPGVNMPTKAPKQSESKSQQEVVRWWRDNCYEWQLDEELLMSFPNQAKRSPKTSSRMLAEGLRSGAPDLFAAIPRGDCAGLFVEMKASGGKLSENQRLMLARLTKAGYATVVCRSSDEAIAAIRCYLNLPTKT